MINQEQLKQLLLTKDPKLKKFFWNGSDENYTLWFPHTESTEMTDDMPEDRVVQVTITRFTTNPKDRLIYDIQELLESHKVPTDDVLPHYDEETKYYQLILETHVLR